MQSECRIPTVSRIGCLKQEVTRQVTRRQLRLRGFLWAEALSHDDKKSDHGCDNKGEQCEGNAKVIKDSVRID